MSVNMAGTAQSCWSHMNRQLSDRAVCESDISLPVFELQPREEHFREKRVNLLDLPGRSAGGQDPVLILPSLGVHPTFSFQD